MFHGEYEMSDQSLLKMVSSPYMEKRRNNYSSDDFDEAITNIKTGEISQAKEVLKYGIPRRMLASTCKNKRDNVAYKRPGPITFLGESEEKDLAERDLAMQKQGLSVGRETIIHKASEIHRHMFGSMCSYGSVGWGWRDQFMSQHGELALRTPQVIKRVRNEASLEGPRSFFCELCQHIIKCKIKNNSCGIWMRLPSE